MSKKLRGRRKKQAAAESKRKRKRILLAFSLSLSFLPLLASRFGFCIIAMARRLPLLLPLLCLVAAGVAAAAPAAADAGAAAASREVRLVLVQLKKKKNPLFFSIRAPRQMQQERRVLYLLRKFFRSISAFPSKESSSLAPGAANSKNRAIVIERKARCCFWCRSPGAIIKNFASHSTRTRARSRPRPRAFNNSPQAREMKLAENSIRAER